MPMLISVQLLRALAAWLVVGHHVMQLFFNFEAHNALEDLLVERAALAWMCSSSSAAW